jgi:thiol-disulfide isomerase/thioredoxin
MQAAPRWPLLDTLRGKVVLVDFWASWCAPCLHSFPWMNDLQKSHGGAGFVIVAVNVDQDPALADAFLKKVPAQFRVEYDAKGELARQFGVQAMPTSFLIDRDGNVRVHHAGFKEKQREEREAEIVKLLKEPR